LKTVSKTKAQETKLITDIIWDAWPKIDEKLLSYIFASDEELDRATKERRIFEDKVLEDEGPVNGYIRILEEELDMLTERLNSLVDYVQSAEEWKSRAMSEYALIRKNLASRLSEMI
jgi:hypothetical protein